MVDSGDKKITDENSLPEEDALEDSNFESVFDAEVRFAIHDIREDLGRHLNLSSDRQNAMIMIVGILLAFASLLFINIYPEGGILHDLMSFESMSTIAMAVCCFVGVITLLFWRGDKHLEGNIDSAIERFNEEKWFEVQKELLLGLSKSQHKTHEENSRLSKTIKLMVFIISFGLVLMMIGRV